MFNADDKPDTGHAVVLAYFQKGIHQWSYIYRTNAELQGDLLRVMAKAGIPEADLDEVTDNLDNTDDYSWGNGQSLTVICPEYPPDTVKKEK